MRSIVSCRISGNQPGGSCRHSTMRTWIPGPTVIALLMVLAGCGSTATTSTGVPAEEPPQVPAPPPETGDFMALDGPAPLPGEQFWVIFDESNRRGGAFVLQPWTGDTWAEPVYLLISDANGSPPTATRITPTNYGWEDWGNGGRGPDGFLLPDDIEPGTWRLCTANAADEACMQLAVGDPEDASPDSEVDLGEWFGIPSRLDLLVVGRPYRAVEATLDGSPVPLRDDSEVVITFLSPEQLNMTYDQCTYGGARFELDEGRLTTSEWESDAGGCDRSTNEIRDLLFELFGPRNDALTARSDGHDLQLSTTRALLRLTADLSPTDNEQDESVEDPSQPGSQLPAVDPLDFEQFRPVSEREILFAEPIPTAEAVAWAQASGFTTVLLASGGGPSEDMYLSTRIVLNDDANGTVRSATVG